VDLTVLEFERDVEQCTLRIRNNASDVVGTNSNRQSASDLERTVLQVRDALVCRNAKAQAIAMFGRDHLDSTSQLYLASFLLLKL
jgi:hypothetical protein